MPRSGVSGECQATIPREIRKALGIKPGDTLEYVVRDDHAMIRAHPGALASKGTGMPFFQIRQTATLAARRREHIQRVNAG
jgi:AbrB family looped-hinge helix DNA binding protein